MPGSHRITKHTVLSSGLHDADIRPPALLNEFKRLSLRDAAHFLGDESTWESVACTGCGEDRPKPAFVKEGFPYSQCRHCSSLYVNPRPRAADVTRYYAESDASRFRVAQFSEASASQRRIHLVRSRASWIAQVADTHLSHEELTYGDWETYSPAILEEVAEQGRFGACIGISPVVPLEGVAGAARPEDLPLLDALSAFEKLEHQPTPEQFLQTLCERLKPGGLLFLTTRTCSGFDLQVLWDKAPYIFVPEHMNLLSIEGLELLLQRCGLELIELSTPGQLDVELVLQALAADPSVVLPPFVQPLLTQRGSLAHQDFQAFLQKHRLSSHVRLVARRPES